MTALVGAAPGEAAPADAAWYAIIDTAQDPALHPLVTACRDVQCLVGGVVPPALAATLPHLVRLYPDEALAAHWRTAGAGRGWGIMMQTALSGDALRAHLKTFLNARLPDGAVVWFRFYDPLILRTFLREATPAELTPWFRHVIQFVVEDGEQRHQLWLRDGRLMETALPSA